jgi:hypothetical protein
VHKSFRVSVALHYRQASVAAFLTRGDDWQSHTLREEDGGRPCKLIINCNTLTIESPSGVSTCPFHQI